MAPTPMVSARPAETGPQTSRMFRSPQPAALRLTPDGDGLHQGKGSFSGLGDSAHHLGEAATSKHEE